MHGATSSATTIRPGMSWVPLRRMCSPQQHNNSSQDIVFASSCPQPMKSVGGDLVHCLSSTEHSVCVGPQEASERNVDTSQMCTFTCQTSDVDLDTLNYVKSASSW